MHCEHCVTSVTLPDSVTIFGTRINVHVNEVYHRELRELDYKTAADVKKKNLFKLPETYFM